jgi:hypothetical protein
VQASWRNGFCMVLVPQHMCPLASWTPPIMATGTKKLCSAMSFLPAVCWVVWAGIMLVLWTHERLAFVSTDRVIGEFKHIWIWCSGAVIKPTTCISVPSYFGINWSCLMIFRHLRLQLGTVLVLILLLMFFLPHHSLLADADLQFRVGHICYATHLCSLYWGLHGRSVREEGLFDSW